MADAGQLFIENRIDQRGLARTSTTNKSKSRRTLLNEKLTKLRYSSSQLFAEWSREALQELFEVVKTLQNIALRLLFHGLTPLDPICSAPR